MRGFAIPGVDRGLFPSQPYMEQHTWKIVVWYVVLRGLVWLNCILGMAQSFAVYLNWSWLNCILGWLNCGRGMAQLVLAYFRVHQNPPKQFA